MSNSYSEGRVGEGERGRGGCQEDFSPIILKERN
jgi:hypothetical protein